MEDRFVSFGGSHIHGTSLAFEVVRCRHGWHPPAVPDSTTRSVPATCKYPVRLAGCKSWYSATTTCVYGVAILDDVARTGHMSKEYIMRIKLSHITSVVAAGAARQ
jgi:hypothetical protein